MTSYTRDDVYHTQLTKEYKRDGNQSSVTDIFGKTKGYTYDSAGRLSSESVSEDDTTISYTYDTRGNRQGKYNSSNEEYVRYNYDANNRLESEVIDLLNSGYYMDRQQKTGQKS